MEYVDDRTKDQKNTHIILIAGTDTFMSGWGSAEGGTSIAVWACRPEDESEVYAWVSGRSDMSRVRIVSDPYRPTGTGHCHVYAVGSNHSSLREKVSS